MAPRMRALCQIPRTLTCSTRNSRYTHEERKHVESLGRNGIKLEEARIEAWLDQSAILAEQRRLMYDPIKVTYPLDSALPARRRRLWPNPRDLVRLWNKASNA
jgi:hypothetical protein